MAVTTCEWLCFLDEHENTLHRKYALQFAIKMLEKNGTINCLGIPHGGWVYQQIVDYSPFLSDAEAIMDSRALRHYNGRSEDSKIHPEDDPDSDYFDPEEDDETPKEVVDYMLTQRHWIWQNRFRAPERRLLCALGSWNDNEYLMQNFVGPVSNAEILRSPKMRNAVLDWYHS